MILATLCYIKKDGRTLMVHRNKKPNDMHAGKWNGLGGKFEPGESPEECIIREVQEKSGCKFAIRNCTACSCSRTSKVMTGTCSSSHPASSRHLINSPEGKLEWIPDENMTALNLWESDQIFFPWLDSDQFFSAKFIYAGDQMQSYDVSFHP